MLIEFSVSNFRSIRERQTLSMVAAPRLRKRENVFVPDVDGEKLPALLKVVAIYGPNASGKSNLIRALGVIEQFTMLKPGIEPKILPVSPFRFDSSTINEPSRFEVHFVEHRQRYMFELAATPLRVVEEKLTAYPRGKTSLLYSRKHTAKGDVYEFGEQLEGGKTLHDAWRNLTGPDVLFLTQAAANSNEELTQLRIPLSWLSNMMFTMSSSFGPLRKHSEALMTKSDWYKKSVASLLQEVDLPISGINSKVLDTANEDNTSDSSSNREKLKYKTTLTHVTALGQANFDIEEESDGTKNLISFSFPWLLMDPKYGINSNAKSLEIETNILVVDELDSSLHPKIVETLIARFISKPNSAQLIFTTHDTHLMNAKLLRRDQYWLTERDENGATQLRSIHEFEGRESEDIEKRYYEGRYRSLPIIKRV